MRCEDLGERIALHVTGDLPPRQAARVEAHLARCSRCQELADGFRRTARALESLGAEGADERASREVRSRVLERLRRGDAVPRPGSAPWRWAVAAGVLLSLTLAIAHRARHTDPPPCPGPIIPGVGVPPPTVASAAAVDRPPAKPSSRHRRAAGSAEASRGKEVTTAREPMVVKLLTDDPEVVIYWLVGENGG